MIGGKLVAFWSQTSMAQRVSVGGAFCLLLIVSIWLLSPGSGDRRVVSEPLPDFASIEDVNEMKAAFFDYLTPIIEQHNQAILVDREQLQAYLRELESSGRLSDAGWQWIEQLAAEYEFDLNRDEPLRTVRRLLLRVDEIPLELALVQAAKESGWGRSRFAVEANNLFGQWCYEPGCGVVPAQRPAGQTYEVTRFESVADAIGAYMRNLNTHPPYETLRLMRAGMRAGDEPLDGLQLVDGLLHYSQRREAYVDEVASMIRQYRSFQSERTEAVSESHE